MKKLMQRTFSILLAVAMLCTMSISAIAAEGGTSELENVVTQMKYIVYTKNGNVRETGVTPDPALRYL